uniref:hypothetical protein ycf53 n=1 Tax=Nemalion vermiculare TaxID=935621 RepID=UPI002580DD22|nr:hypothetical protein ycf53 [Nemalion vermiculare]WGV34366.1 hypothetical protein ycf53 [Nemalion vermiculare]
MNMIKTNNTDSSSRKLLMLSSGSSGNSSLKSQQFALIHEIYSTGYNGQKQLLSVLLSRQDDPFVQISDVDGLIFELLRESKYNSILNDLNKFLASGIVALNSAVGIDYSPLQQLLVTKQFQSADKLTQVLLCNLSQVNGRHDRKWLYFTDISLMPTTDLLTIDKLWQVHSQGLFGLSVQRDIWLSTNSDWETFWSKIGWKVNNVNCRYPNEFVWNVTAPPGHLPLFNQLRGVQVLAALFTHPAWDETSCKKSH